MRGRLWLLLTRPVDKGLGVMFDQHLTRTRHQFLDKRVECANHRHQRHSVVLNKLIVSLGASQFAALTRCIYGRSPAGCVRMTQGIEAAFLVDLGVEQLP